MDSMHRYQMRRATSTDVDSITACVQAAYDHYIERLGKPPGPMQENYAVIIDDHWVAVAVASSVQVAGFVVIKQTASGLLLDNVAVLPELQGQGIGKRLIVYAEQYAEKTGASGLALYTHVLMTENIAMYAALGYVETERKTVNGYDRVYFNKAFG